MSTLNYQAVASIQANLNDVKMFHTDRGKEFDNELISEALDTFRIQRSLSMKGCPYDNAVAEAMFKVFKIEFANGAIFYPIIINAFKGPVMLVHYFLAFYSHLFFSLFGILIGAFFSFTFVSKKYVWLLTVLAILLSLTYNGVVEAFPILKWILFILPPVINIIGYMQIGDNSSIESHFWFDAIYVIIYTIVLFLIVKRLFLVREK